MENPAEQPDPAERDPQRDPDDDDDRRHPDPNSMADEEEPTEEFIPDMEKIKVEQSRLTERQEQEHWRVIRALHNLHDSQVHVEANKRVLRLRDQFLHVHGTLGSERVVDIVVVMKAMQMVEQGMRVCILNLNFLKRLQSRALYFYLRDYAMRRSANLKKLRNDKVFLKIQEEDADEVDINKMMDDLNDYAEDWPLFVITDETCKEAERIDDAIDDLTMRNHRFHFWTSSSYSHGTPEAAERYRLALKHEFAPPVRQVMDMIDIDDDDLSIAGRHKPPISRVMQPFPEEGPDYNLREHLDLLKVFLISHNKTHIKADVWECKDCGKLLADYLNNTIELGKPGLANNEVFIVGHLERFESKVTISGMQMSLLEQDIESGAMFCRRAVRIQDILKTMSGVVVSDSISMRGVDKQIVIIIPNPRDQKVQARVELEMRKRKEREAREERDKKIAYGDTVDNRDQEMACEVEVDLFVKPKAVTNDDEIVIFLRPMRKGEIMDGIQDYRQRKRKKTQPEVTGEDLTDDEELSEDEGDHVVQPEIEPQKRETEEIRFSQASHQSMLRRAVNSMSRADKDMILDVLTDSPRHAILFHFAEDEFQTDPYLF